MPKLHEKPQNGIKGLKHWKNDLIAGAVVSFVSVPLSMGIAIASGASPICGLASAIIAGFVLPFLGGSYVTISGPAAGLAPILYNGMLTLGNNNLKTGYPLLLPVIFFTGIIQIILYVFKLARFSQIFPISAIQGMLTAIGIMIIAKQLPMLIGHPYVAHEFWGIIFETPKELLVMDRKVFALGIFTFVLIFIFATQSKKIKLLQIIPPQMLAVIIGTIVGIVVHLDPRFQVHIPENPLAHGITFPDFKTLFNNSSLWYSATVIVITLTLVDGIESLATITAIDKIDPFKRKSDPNKTLLAMGISNACSSIIGGLTIIPGGVKSTTCIMAGGKTQWANFYNACFLLLYLFLFREYINLIPLTVLAAVLVYTGYKLCKPSIWYQIAHIGMEQFIIFSLTVFVTLSTDLMWGILSGIALEFLLLSYFTFSIEYKRHKLNSHNSYNLLEVMKRLFQNPVSKSKMVNDEYHLYFNKPLVCFNSLHLSRELSNIPREAKTIHLNLTKGVTLIDHTTCENLLNLVDSSKVSGQKQINIIGMECMNGCSTYPSSMRLINLELSEAAEII